MTINDPDLYMAGIWDWGILRGCFGGVIEPTDIDGMVERNGKFLILETKAAGVGNIPLGQQIAFKRLIQTGHFTVIVIWGEKNNPEEIEMWTRKTHIPRRPCNLKTLQSYCKKWYEWANNGAGASN